MLVAYPATVWGPELSLTAGGLPGSEKEGGSFTAFTVKSNVSVAVWPLLAVTLTVIVVVPPLAVLLAFVFGVIVKVREPPLPVNARCAPSLVPSAVFEDVAVTEPPV